MSDTTPATSTTTSPYVSVHRWPWRTEEFVTMGIAFVACAAIGYLTHSPIGLMAGPAAGVLAVLALWRVKVKRTTISAVTVTLTGETAKTESAGPIGKSYANLAQVSSIGVRRFQSDQVFMIAGGGSGVRIPLRSTRDPQIARFVRDAAARAETVSSEAAAFLAQVHA